MAKKPAMTDAERQRKCREKKKEDRKGCTPYNAIKFRAKRYVWLGSPKPVASDFSKPFKGDIERAIKEAEKRKGVRNEVVTDDASHKEDLKELLLSCCNVLARLGAGTDPEGNATLQKLEKYIKEMDQRKET